MGREEQIEEREVLDSIFPDEIHDVSEVKFNARIDLDITNDGDDETPPPSLLLSVEFTEAYPDTAPILDILPPPNATAHAYLDINHDKVQLLQGLEQTVEDNLGMQMTFTLVSTLKELAEDLIAERQEAARQVEEKKLLALEAEENKKFHGTPVNVDTFPNWRDAFRKEMQEKREQEDLAEEAAELKRNRGKEKAVGLTGRQLWERGMAGKFEEEGDDIPVAQMAATKV